MHPSSEAPPALISAELVGQGTVICVSLSLLSCVEFQAHALDPSIGAHLKSQQAWAHVTRLSELIATKAGMLPPKLAALIELVRSTNRQPHRLLDLSSTLFTTPHPSLHPESSVGMVFFGCLESTCYCP